MKKGLLFASVVLLALGVSASASGTVRTLLTGRDIKDGSITSADIADGTLKLKDLSESARVALAGNAGSKGVQGEAGPIGPTGAPGSTGSAGAIGPQGASGPQGPTGPQGPAGATGSQGAAGHDGADGSSGTDGTNGATGPQGPQGAAGPQGPQGVVGPQGPAGKDGGLYFPSLVDINPLPLASHESGWSRIWINTSSVNNGYLTNCCDDPDATGDSVEWDIPLSQGDWRMQVIYATDVNAGVMTFSLDGNDIGTIDGYGAYDLNDTATFDSIHVDSSGTHALEVRIDSKNESSTGHFGYVAWIRLVKS